MPELGHKIVLVRQDDKPIDRLTQSKDIDHGRITDEWLTKHIDLSTFHRKWTIKFSDSQCAICDKHTYLKVFFTRSRAAKEFTEVTNKEESDKMRRLFNIPSLQKSMFRNQPLIFTSFTG